ncbi:MAG: VacJ family lipoprotein [Lautropia sp.]|nr:VacJ family lipoprotein [Lautropia sp.]
MQKDIFRRRERAACALGVLMLAGLAGCASSQYQMDSAVRQGGALAGAHDAAQTQTQTHAEAQPRVQQAHVQAGTSGTVPAQAATGLRGLKLAQADAAATTATDAAGDVAGGAAAGAGDAAGAAADALKGGVADNLPTAGLKMEHFTTYDPKDPLQAYNRIMHNFNDKADRYALKPIAQAYDFVVPDAVQLVVRNVFSNLGDVWNGVNNLLQWKPKDALVDVSRFVVNTTLGLGGLGDVATAIGLEKHNEDFGQTLGRWGVPAGPYFVIPLLGPSTVRDTLARPVDGYGSYFAWTDNAALRNGMYATEKVSDRASLLEAEKALDDAALDRYTLMRDGWLARRQNLVYDGNPPEEDDPYGEDPYADDPYAEDPTQPEGGEAAGGSAGASGEDAGGSGEAGGEAAGGADAGTPAL